MNRMNLICLGVKDLKQARDFYHEVLGFETANKEENPSIVFFNNQGTKLELYPLEALAKDIDADNPPKTGAGFSGITLAYNAKSKAEVDALFLRLKNLGVRIVKPPQTVSWGGYSGYFQDPDGYYWEIAYAEGWQFDDQDMLVIE